MPSHSFHSPQHQQNSALLSGYHMITSKPVGLHSLQRIHSWTPLVEIKKTRTQNGRRHSKFPHSAYMSSKWKTTTLSYHQHF